MPSLAWGMTRISCPRISLITKLPYSHSLQNLLLGWAPYLVTQKLQIPTMTRPLLQNSHILIPENKLEVCVLGDWFGASHQHCMRKSQEVLSKTWSQNSGWHITILPMFLWTVWWLSCSLPCWILKLHPLLKSLCFPLYFIHQLENTSVVGETSLAFCSFISLPVQSLKCNLAVNRKQPLFLCLWGKKKPNDIAYEPIFSLLGIHPSIPH